MKINGRLNKRRSSWPYDYFKLSIDNHYWVGDWLALKSVWWFRETGKNQRSFYLFGKKCGEETNPLVFTIIYTFV